MTPGEFRAMLEERVKWYERQRGDLDAIGAYQCYIAATCAGNKGLKITDFMIFREKKPEEPMSEKDWNNALGAWAGVGGR